MKSPISIFCEEKGIPDGIKRSFSAFIRSEMARKYDLGNDTDTVSIMTGNLTQKQVEQYWQEFVKALVKYLPSNQ